MTDFPPPQPFAVSERTVLKADDIVSALTALDADLRLFWAKLFTDTTRVGEALVAKRDLRPLLGRLMLDGEYRPAQWQEALEADARLRTEAEGFDVKASDEEAVRDLRRRLVLALRRADNKIFGELLHIHIESAAAVACGLPNSPVVSRLVPRFQRLGLSPAEAEMVNDTACAIGRYLDAEDEADDTAETKAGENSPEEKSDLSSAGSRIVCDTEVGSVSLCNVGSVVPVRDITAAVRKLPKKTRSAYAFVHNSLFAIARLCPKRTYDEDLAGLRASLGDPSDAEPVLAQLEAAAVASEVLKRDAAECGGNPSLIMLRDALEPLAAAFREKRDKHPLYAATGLLLQYAAVRLGVPECQLEDRVASLFPYRVDLVRAAIGAKCLMSLHTQPESHTAEYILARDKTQSAVERAVMKSSASTKRCSVALWAELAKRLSRKDLVLFGRWALAAGRPAACCAETDEGLRGLSSNPSEKTEEDLRTERRGVLAFVDFSSRMQNAIALREAEWNAAAEEELPVEEVEETASRIAEALHSLSGQGAGTLRLGILLSYGLSRLIERDEIIREGRGQPGEQLSVITPCIAEETLNFSLVAGKLGALLNRAEKEARIAEEVAHVQELARLFGED